MAEDTMDGVILHYVESTSDAIDFIEWVKHPNGPVAIDTETTGLERDAYVRLIQFGDRDVAWTLRRDRYPGAILEALNILQQSGVRLVFHNAPFDVPKIERLFEGEFHFDWGLLEDTMILSRVISPLGGHGLKVLSARHVDPRARQMEAVLKTAMLDNKWTWATVPYDYVGYNTYAGIDCILTARLLPKLEAMPYVEAVYDTEIAAMEACVAMSEVGMMTDQDYCHEQIIMLGEEVDDLAKQAKATFGVTALGSNQIMVNKLNDQGFYWNKRTEKGAVALDKEVLEELTNRGSDLALLIHSYRTRVKLLNTYFKNFVSHADAAGAIHPDINTLEAVTGRMSVTEPAMQTLPRGPRARRAFISRPGHQLVLADYSQIEMRLLAHFCKDPSLIEAINSGDLHTAIGEMIYGPGKVTREVRDVTKNAGYSIIYGAGPEKFSHTAKIPVEEGTDFMRQYHARFPQIRPFIDYVQTIARQRKRQSGSAYVTTPAGRQLHARKIDAEYTLVNYLIQGSAADIFKQAIVRLHANGFGSYMRLPVHDECIFEIPMDVDAEEFKREVEKIMSDDSWEVPIVVEAGGPYHTWADKYGTD